MELLFLPRLNQGPGANHPAKVAPHLLDAVHLPVASADYGGTESLIAKLSAEACERVGITDEYALLATTLFLGTWVDGCLTTGFPILNWWGPAGTERAALDFTAAVSRRALRLLVPSPTDTAALPPGLAPTIILHDLTGSSPRRLLAVAGGNGVHLLRGGRLFPVRYSIVLFTRGPIPGALNIPLPTIVRGRRFTPRDAGELRDRFQPQLLRFRLTRHTAVANSLFDVEGFAPSARGWLSSSALSSKEHRPCRHDYPKL